MSTEGDIIDSYGNSLRNLKQSFQAGVDTLYDKCVSCGWTPTGKTPTHIAEAIQGIYGNRYTEGYNNGYNAGKTATKQVSVRTFISSHAWQCYAITYINDKEVCRVDSRNPSDDSTITKSNTATANV